MVFTNSLSSYYEKFLATGEVKCIDEEIPFEIPKGWEWSKLSNVIELLSGQDFIPEKYNSSNQGIPYITGASNIVNGNLVINRCPYRSHRDNLNLYFVRSADGTMIPVTALGTTHYTTGAGTIKRFNMFYAATITGEAAHGYSSGQAMDALQKIVKDRLPESIGVEWSGLSYQEKHESGKTGLVLTLAFLFVFLFLAAQYESWSVPIAVILSLPVAGIGAYMGIWVCGLENNIYFQIGLVMLIGLVAKNAILIVEFAKAEVEKGRAPSAAALTAMRLRFRPIVMTSLAFILGLIPLVIATGPGSASRQGRGTGVFFGMLVAVTVGIVFVPLFFVAIYNLKEKYRARRNKPATKIPSDNESN